MDNLFLLVFGIFRSQKKRGQGVQDTMMKLKLLKQVLLVTFIVDQ